MLYEAIKSESFFLLEGDYSFTKVTYSILRIFLFSVLWRFFNKQANIFYHFILSWIYDLMCMFFFS